MEVLVRGQNIKVTKAISDYVTLKLKKIDKYLGDNENVKATALISVKGYNQKVEITIPLKSYMVRAEETKEDLYASIDLVVDKLERQIRKNKTRIASKKMKGASKDFVVDEIEDDTYDEEENKVVKRKKVETKPMSEEEAILQMELLGHQFYIFKDAETLKPTVVYIRKDGGYGIIETE